MSADVEPALEPNHIAAVVPMSFYRRKATYLLTAIEALLGLDQVGSVIVLHDRKDPYAPGW